MAADLLDATERAVDRHAASRRARRLAEGEDVDAAGAVVELERVVGVSTLGDAGVECVDGPGQADRLSVVSGRAGSDMKGFTVASAPSPTVTDRSRKTTRRAHARIGHRVCM